MNLKFFNLFAFTMLTIATIFFSCKEDEILVVTLDIGTRTDIEKIILTSNGGRDSITKNEIGSITKFKLKSPQKGEGVFKVCVFTIKDTICSEENYVESGYRPKLKLDNNKIVSMK